MAQVTANKELVDSIPSRARHSINKRNAITAAAAELFLKEGYGQVSMDRIAQSAGVSKQTVYSHFQSKEVLFEALVTERCDEMLSMVPEPLDRARPVAEVLGHLGHSFLRLVLADDAINLYRTVLAESIRFPELGRAFYNAGPKRSHIRLASYLSKEAAKGTLAIDDPQVAAEQFFGMVKGDLYNKGLLGLASTSDIEAIDLAVERAVTVFMSAYAVKGEPAK
ncbi:MAG: TetR/AcrR family transcriptional regulator [Rhodospirillales bacterium]